MNRLAFALALGLLACGRREPATDEAGSGSAGSGVPPGTLFLVAELRGIPQLVEGTGRIALRFVDEAFWYETSSSGLVLRADVGDRIARQIAELGGGEPDVLLGAAPIVSGGEHHHEKHVRVAQDVREIAVEGFVDQVAAFDSGDEIWRIEHEAQKQLAIVHTDGRVTPVPPLPRLGKEVESMSPVSAKICARPQTVDLASNGTAIVALVRECDLDAPYRILRYQLPGPTPTVTQIPSQNALGFEARAIAISATGDVALVGTRGDAHAIGRIDSAGKVTVTTGPTGVRVIGEAIRAADGTVWSAIAIGGGSLLRDHQGVALRSPRGDRLRAVELWHDRNLGVVAIAADRDDRRYLFAERAPSHVVAIPPR